jgi:hypothetical protein
MIHISSLKLFYANAFTFLGYYSLQSNTPYSLHPQQKMYFYKTLLAYIRTLFYLTNINSYRLAYCIKRTALYVSPNACWNKAGK